MPYVVGTYRDKIGTAHYLLFGEKRSVADCKGAIRWQMTGCGITAGRRCIPRTDDENDLRTEWHIVEPLPEAVLAIDVHWRTIRGAVRLAPQHDQE